MANCDTCLGQRQCVNCADGYELAFEGLVCQKIKVKPVKPEQTTDDEVKDEDDVKKPEPQPDNSDSSQ